MDHTDLAIWYGDDQNADLRFLRGQWNGTNQDLTDVMTLSANGNVGIGTTSPGAKLDVDGDLRVTGAYKGNIGPNNGAPFPRPAYDSGWVDITQDSTTTINHNLGGNTDNYVVDVCFYDYETGPNKQYVGGVYFPITDVYYGAYWFGLTDQRIKIHRYQDDVTCDMVRVRIWVYN